ncbi:MAG: hypothetical protein R3C17_08935 [Planctomycetaceae bacterium]
MNKWTLTIVAAALVVAVTMNPVHAQLGKLLREGAEYLGKKAVKVVKEGAESGARKAGSVVDDIAGKTAGKIGTVGGKEAGEQIVVQSGKALAVAGMSSADQILTHLGPKGIQSMGKLTPVGANRLAEVSAELAKSPHKAEWLRMIGESGDAVATFLWERKLSVGVAAAATAVVLAPSDFVQAGENVATSAITTVGANVIQPLITETAQHVAGPVAREVTKQAAANFPWTLSFCLMFMGVAGGLGYLLLAKR